MNDEENWTICLIIISYFYDLNNLQEQKNLLCRCRKKKMRILLYTNKVSVLVFLIINDYKQLSIKYLNLLQ